MNELDFINWICSREEKAGDFLNVGPGDDCAVFTVGGEKVVVTVDQVLDGVHFDSSKITPFQIGRKAMARAISDIAAMAAVPLAAVASASLPKGFTEEQAREVHKGRKTITDLFNCPVIGGDIGSWDGKLTISITVFGKADGIEPVLRSGAKPGDAICVSGSLGAAWRTERHLEFTPRIFEARKLANLARPTAMIDISDGLGLDLMRICKASKVSAEIQADKIPINSGATLEQALGDGEDYELLFTIPESDLEKVQGKIGVDITQIGTILDTPQADEMWIIKDGNREKLQPAGWQHET